MWVQYASLSSTFLENWHLHLENRFVLDIIYLAKFANFDHRWHMVGVQDANTNWLSLWCYEPLMLNIYIEAWRAAVHGVTMSQTWLSDRITILIYDRESACSEGDPGSIHGMGRSSGEGHGNPLQHNLYWLNYPLWWFSNSIIAFLFISCYAPIDAFFHLLCHYSIHCDSCHHWSSNCHLLWSLRSLTSNCEARG